MGEKVRGLSRAGEEVQNHGPKSAGGESPSRHSQVKVHHRARDRGRLLLVHFYESLFFQGFSRFPVVS